MDIVASVPTYNRPELLLKNIKCLLEQTVKLKKIIIVDNASEEDTYNILLSSGLLDKDEILYHRLDINVGASGGFKKAMELAAQYNPDWIWGMDDDAFPRKDALEALVKSVDVFDINTCFWSNCDEDDLFEHEYKTVDKLIFVGFFLPVSLVKKIGYPDTRFYMYHDDTEYSNRILAANYKIVKVKNSVIDHKGFNKRGDSPFTFHKFLGVNVTLLNCEGYRLYYIYRNEYYIINGGRLERMLYLKKLLLALVKYTLYKRKSLPFVWLAFKHILSGQRGKVL
ncbi:glycosyltransferase [Shewanella vesiculosa]|uniref:glycosyltransferase n=1 Tax=Shewanella vesiculosa TaxID=518738 RepID=UPI003D077D9B